MMWIRMIFLPGMVGLASGLAVAGGMFALLIALGVIARFAGKTNTASWILYYEDAARIGRHFRKPVQSVSVPYPGWNYRSCTIWVVFRNIYRYLGHGSHRDRRCCPGLHQTNPPERRNSMAHSCHGSGTESGSMAACPFRLLNIRFRVKLSPLVVPDKAGCGILFIQTVQGFLPERG